MKQKKYHQSIWESEIKSSWKIITKSSPVLFPFEWEEKKKKTSNSSRIASARTCNATPVDIERATFLWVDLDVDVFLFWQLTPRIKKENKNETYPWAEKFSPDPMILFFLR